MPTRQVGCFLERKFFKAKNRLLCYDSKLYISSHGLIPFGNMPQVSGKALPILKTIRSPITGAKDNAVIKLILFVHLMFLLTEALLL